MDIEIPRMLVSALRQLLHMACFLAWLYSIVPIMHKVPEYVAALYRRWNTPWVQETFFLMARDGERERAIEGGSHLVEQMGCCPACRRRSMPLPISPAAAAIRAWSPLSIEKRSGWLRLSNTGSGQPIASRMAGASR